MTKTIRKIGSLMAACLLAVVLPFSSAASAEGLLEAMTDIALREGRTIEGTLRIEAGELLAALGMSPEGLEDPASAAAIDLLSNGLLRVRYSQVGEQSVTGVALELRGETVLTLDMRTLNDEIALETSLLPGKTLVMPAELVTQSVAAQTPVLPDGDLMEAMAGAAERYGTVVGNWATQSEGIVSELEGPIPATQTRDAATRAMTLHVTDAQWQELLRNLAAEFVKDDALKRALASQMGAEPAELSAMVQQLVDSFEAPQGNAVEMTVFLGDADQIVGIDMTVEPPTSSPADAPAPLQGSFTYGHRSIDAEHAADTYEASFTWGDGYELQAQFGRQDKIPNQFLPDEGEKYGGRAMIRTPDTGALELEVSGDIRRTVEPINETYDHTFDIRLSQKPESVEAGDLAQMLQAPLLEAGFALSSQTEVVGSEDFRSQGSFTLKLMGLEAAVHYTLESSEYTPEEHPENTVIRLEELTSDETDALMLELMENAQGLLGSPQALSERAPALQSYTLDDESVPSIDSVVGFREITNSEAGITDGKPYVQTFYQSGTVMEDLEAYVDFLFANSWVITGMEGDATDGTVQLATESAMDGNLLLITAEFDAGSYSIQVQRARGTLTRYTDEAGSGMGEVTFIN